MPAFCVPYEIYENLIDTTLDKEWYNIIAADAKGKICLDIGLLILDVLKKVVSDYTFLDIQSSINISGGVNKLFFVILLIK